LLVISPWAKENFVDHAVTDQSSTLRFIEDNWSLGRIGNQSFDALAGPLNNMFSFSTAQDGNSQGNPRQLLLNSQTGQPSSSAGNN
jgi:phospholipase C